MRTSLRNRPARIVPRSSRQYTGLRQPPRDRFSVPRPLVHHVQQRLAGGESAEVLQVQRPPAVAGEGGETEFACTAAAFDALPDAEKAKLENLSAVHSVYAGVRPILDYSIGPEEWVGEPSDFTHPLVHTHPGGRKSLVMGVQVEQVVGMKPIHSRAFMQRLMDWAVQPDFKYRHAWQEGDLVMWKNLGAMHRAAPYEEDSGRLMYRTSLEKMKVAA